jgi:hypothetical protein
MQSPDDLPEPALTHDRHGSMLLIGPCYTADQMRAYRAEGVAQERERCAKACEAEGDRWRGEQDITDFRLCAALIRAGHTTS